MASNLALLAPSHSSSVRPIPMNGVIACWCSAAVETKIWRVRWNLAYSGDRAVDINNLASGQDEKDSKFHPTSPTRTLSDMSLSLLYHSGSIMLYSVSIIMLKGFTHG